MKSARTSQDMYSTSKHHPLEQQDQTTGNCQDRISNLPDELLHHILSFLTTKTAISTSILAKRWRYLWTFVYNLNFDYWNDGLKHDSFIGFIDQSLANFPGKKICKFQLIFDIFDVAEEPSLDSEREWIYIAQTSACEWIDFAVSKGVEKLKLDFSSEFESEVEPFLLPKGVYNCCSVTKLKLTFCEIYQVYCKSIRWTALKKLYLKHVYLSSLAMKMILSRSKFLEDLIMIGCFCTGCAKVQSRSLKTLKLEDTLTGFGIFAPNLLSLDIYGHIRRTDVGELSFPSLVDVCLDLSPSFDDNWIWTEKLKKLYGYVCHAKNMKLCDWCIQMLSLLELNVVPAPLSKHSHLELKIELQLDLLGLGRLLKNSPDLETLIVRRGHSHYGSVYRSFHDVLRCWDALKGMNSPLHRLKFVSLYGFVYMGIEGDLDESDRHYIKREDDMKVIKFLLERAVALERLVIYLRKDWKREWSNGPEKAIPERPNASQITERLLAYPRASPHAEVLIVNEK